MGPFILPILTFFPLVGAAILMFLPKEKPAVIKATVDRRQPCAAGDLDLAVGRV